MSNNKEHSCGCGCGSHHHEHHHHDHSCGCGSHQHEHHHEHTCRCNKNAKADKAQLEFLHLFTIYVALPVTRFIASCSTEDFSSVALAPVYIDYANDSMETVKILANFLNKLEHDGFIEIAYGEELEGYDYDVYYKSDLFKFFEETVKEGKEKQGFLCDEAVLEHGSIHLTKLGKEQLG